MRLCVLVVAAVVALPVAACGAAKRAPSRPAHSARAGKVTELRDIAQLRAAFNAHTDMPRLIVLASPT